MGAYGVAIEKETTFRGAAERVSNIYHYRIAVPVASDYDNLAEAVLARDKIIHQPAFTYKTVRVWGPTDGPASSNLMRLVKDVSGAGSQSATGPSVYKELTIVPAIFVGRSPVHNRKVFVRKFIRISSMPNSGDDAVNGLLTTTTRTTFSNWFGGSREVTHNAVSYNMCTPRDVLVPSAETPFTLQYARIRQMKQ